MAFSWQVWPAVAQCDAGQEIQAIGAERAAVTAQSLIEKRTGAVKAMESPNGAAAAVSAITAKAKLAGLWREKADQHSTGMVKYRLGRLGWRERRSRDHHGHGDLLIHMFMTENT